MAEPGQTEWPSCLMRAVKVETPLRLNSIEVPPYPKTMHPIPPRIASEIDRLLADADGDAGSIEWLAGRLAAMKTPVHWKVGKLPLAEIAELATSTDMPDRLLTYRAMLGFVSPAQKSALEELIASTEKLIAGEAELSARLAGRATGR